MTWPLIGINFAFGVIFFLICLLLGRLQGSFSGLFEYDSFHFHSDTGQKFSGNFFQRIVTPTILLALLCAGAQGLGYGASVSQLWLVVPAYWCVRFLVIVLENRQKYINWRYEIFAAAVSLLLSELALWVLILPLIRANEPVFLALTEFRDAFWFAVIAYLAKLSWDLAKGHYTGEKLYPEEKRQNILQSRYVHFLHKYGADIDALLASQCSFDTAEKTAHLRQLVYAIMIYEDYNRPFVKRLVEYAVFALGLRKEMTLGIMQVKTTHRINDIHSIMLAINKLKVWFDPDQDVGTCVDNAIADYHGGELYCREVFGIYSYLIELNDVHTTPLTNWLEEEDSDVPTI